MTAHVRVNRVSTRTCAVTKSAFQGPGARPNAETHFETMKNREKATLTEGGLVPNAGYNNRRSSNVSGLPEVRASVNSCFRSSVNRHAQNSQASSQRCGGSFSRSSRRVAYMTSSIRSDSV